MARKHTEVWVDIDHATRAQMEMSFAQERDAICRHLTQIQIDIEHWNRVNPTQEPLSIVHDFTNDVREGLLVREMRPKPCRTPRRSE
jgi:hypothetical protein